jgi:HEAT repeat protein
MKSWVFFLRRSLLSHPQLIALAVTTCAFSLTAAPPSDALLRIIPDVEQRLKSDGWTNRAGVLDLLIRRLPGTRQPEFESRYDLPRDDYGYVINAVIESIGQSPDGKPWRKLEESMLAWIYIIKKFNLVETTDRIARLLEGTNSVAKGFSLVMLGMLETREYDVAIARLLRPENAQFHREARDLLVKYRSKEVVPTLIQELGNEHEVPRYYALDALEKVADSSAISALGRSVSDPHENNRSAALRALVSTFEKQKAATNVIPYARNVVHNSKEARTISHALALMVHYGASDAIPAVMDRLISTNDFYMMDECLREVDSRIMIPAYINALESERMYAGAPAADEHVRNHFIFELGRLKAQQAVPVLLKLFLEKHPFHWYEAIQALGKIRSPDAVLPLMGFLKEKNAPANLREAVVIALFQARDRRAAQVLREYITAPNVELGGVASILGSLVFRDFARKFNNDRMEFEAQGTPVEILSRLTRETGIPIHVKLPKAQSTDHNSPVLKIMTMSKGHPMEAWVVLAMNNLSAAYKTRFYYLIGDNEVFLAPNTEWPEILLTVFDKMTNSK